MSWWQGKYNVNYTCIFRLWCVLIPYFVQRKSPSRSPLLSPTATEAALHYSDFIMSAMASQITSVSIVCSAVCSGADQRETSKLCVTGLCYWPSQRMETVFIGWRHHVARGSTMIQLAAVTTLTPHIRVSTGMAEMKLIDWIPSRRPQLLHGSRLWITKPCIWAIIPRLNGSVTGSVTADMNAHNHTNNVPQSETTPIVKHRLVLHCSSTHQHVDFYILMKSNHRRMILEVWCFSHGLPYNACLQTSDTRHALVGNKIVGRLNTWLQCFGKRMLQDETRNVWLYCRYKQQMLLMLQHQHPIKHIIMSKRRFDVMITFSLRYVFAGIPGDGRTCTAKLGGHDLKSMMTSSNGNFFSRYWHFVRGIHRSPVNSPHKGQWRGALIFFWSVLEQTVK